MIALAALPVAAPAAVVAPSDPVAGEKLLISTSVCQGGSPTTLLAAPSVEVQQGNVRVRAELAMGDFAVGSCQRIRAISTPLAAGSYDVSFTWSAQYHGTNGPASLARVTVASRPSDVAPQYRRLNGNWFDPAAPGTGVNIVQGVSGALFAAWATHGPRGDNLERGLVNGTPEYAFGGWYVMSEGLWIAPNVFRGPLYQTRGETVERPWDPAKLAMSPVGFAKFTFTNEQEVRFEAVLTHGTDSHFTTTQTLRRFRF